MRLGTEVRGVRFGIFLRLPVQPRLELADDADAAGVQPPAGLRAPLRHREARASAGRTWSAAARSSDPSSTSPSKTPARCSAGSGPRTAQKLDQYLAGVREIETRIEKAERFGEVRDPQVETPAGVPPDYAEYVQLMFDMLILAFQTDSTRVATLMLAHDGSNRSFDHIGISEGHHDLTHHQNRPDWIEKVADIDLWYVRQFARFLEKLQATKDVDGNSLLHNSMIVYGSGNADGNRHTHDNLPVVLAGGGGGTLTPGRYVKHGSKPLTNLYLSMADRLGLRDLERFGDSRPASATCDLRHGTPFRGLAGTATCCVNPGRESDLEVELVRGCRDEPGDGEVLRLEHFHKIDALSLRRRRRRLERGSHLEDDGRRGAAHLHDDDPDGEPSVYLDA